jgi:hypothetical protein
MLSVALISGLVLALAFDPYERGVVAIVDWTLDRRRNFAIFLVLLFVTPLVLMVL